MKQRLIRKNIVRRNPETLMLIFLDWVSYKKSYNMTINDVLDMLHLSPQSYDHILSSKNSTTRDVMITKLYDKYMEINGKFRKIDNLARTMLVTDHIFNRRLTPIDYSDVLRFGWQYENFRWIFYKLIMKEDNITQYLLDKGIDKYTSTFMDIDMLEHYVFCIADPDSIYSIPESTFNGLCNVIGYMLGINTTFLNGLTIYPILLDKHINSDRKLKEIEISRMLLLYHIDNTFDMNDDTTRRCVGSSLIDVDGESYKYSIRTLERMYDVDLCHNNDIDFKKKLKYYDQFITV